MDSDLAAYISAEIQAERSEFESSAEYQMHKTELRALLADLTARVNAEHALQGSQEAVDARSLDTHTQGTNHP